MRDSRRAPGFQHRRFRARTCQDGLLASTAIDGTTGTELTLPSQTTYDSRWLRTIGGTVTPTSNGTATLRVTKADGTTVVFGIDTTNSSLLLPNPGDNINFAGNTIIVNQTNGTLYIKNGFTIPKRG